MKMHSINLFASNEYVIPSQSPISPNNSSLIDRLKSLNKEAVPAMLKDVSFLQKFIVYAKAQIHPTISPEASAYLREFYLDLRKNYTPSKSFPVTPRTLESLIRLSKARAKIELSHTVTLKHAVDVVELMIFCLSSCDFEKALGTSSKKRSKFANTRNFIAALESISDQNEFSTNEMKQIAVKEGIKIPNWDEFIHVLNMNGYIVKTSRGMYKRV